MVRDRRLIFKWSRGVNDLDLHNGTMTMTFDLQGHGQGHMSRSKLSTETNV